MEYGSDAIKAFFREYERNTSIGDAESLASQYADSFVSADPSGARVVRAADLKAAIPGRKKLFESIGCQPTTLVSMEETKLDERYVLVKTAWRMQFDRESGRSLELTLLSTFIIHWSGEAFRIVFYLTHESIMTVLREHGLLPPQPP